ncbi:MAG TPA: YolD-like family protein [Candidatus Erysipelatoclostridium merdavium]|uniref:YolD-like family protein n=1 Tax=Candidatus Erysipelatoclostridium merdavium TaxID=2838566 RepID=A0A9D1XK58_9FIRM|nr:YolD-like family protein [Candidatus Erysipelatoclostridium merdavium]
MINYLPKKILSEDDLAELDYMVHQIKVRMIIQVTYYGNNQYVQIEGIVSKLNLDTKMIQIVKTKLDLTNIINISF